MDNWIRNQTTAGVQLNHASSNFCVEILAKKMYVFTVLQFPRTRRNFKELWDFSN